MNVEDQQLIRVIRDCYPVTQTVANHSSSQQGTRVKWADTVAERRKLPSQQLDLRWCGFKLDNFSKTNWWSRRRVQFLMSQERMRILDLLT